jgi:hypothetical protein
VKHVKLKIPVKELVSDLIHTVMYLLCYFRFPFAFCFGLPISKKIYFFPIGVEKRRKNNGRKQDLFQLDK